MVREKTKAKPAAKAAAAPEGIVVTAQQSRFHVDATDTPTSREIDIKDLTLSINGRELISNANLKLKDGTHYVFVGRNGTGKSTLLRALAEERIPGIAANLHCLLLGQIVIQNSEDGGGLDKSKLSTLEYVLKSDYRRERALREFETLNEGLNSANPFDGVRAHRRVKHGRLEYTLKRAQLIAARRSGARGWDARGELNRIEELVEASKDAMDEGDATITTETIEVETKAAAELLDEIQATLDATEAETADTRAKELLRGLRFTLDMIDAPFTSLSGGWRMRCELASALFQKPHVLLLDEPTNFLDLPTILWLQNYVLDVACTVLVVTHDRDFADAVGEELIILRDQKLETFDGNLSLYERERDAKIKQMTRMKEALDKKTSLAEKAIENNLSAARRTGDDKKYKQAAQRKKKLEERTGLEVSAKGTRFKLNRDMAGYSLTNRAEIEIPQNNPLVQMSFPAVPPDLRFPGALVTFANVSFKYPKAKDKVLQDVSLAVHLGDRIGFAGANGSGKSTLVKLAIANENEPTALQPTNGTITRHPRLRIGYFSQHTTEELEELGTSRPELTALSHLMEVAGADLPEPKARGLLSAMGLPGRIASDIPLGSLSGGQRVRLALAKLVWTPPQLLVLDEVTTHLDADTIFALIHTLKMFQGALIVVTHDRFFMRCVVEREKVVKRGDDDGSEDSSDEEADEEVEETRRRVVYRIVKGAVKELPRGMAQYEEIAARSAAKAAQK